MNKIKIHSITRTDNRRFPKHVLQLELKNIRLFDKKGNTENVAVLEGDISIEYLVAISLYDSRPIYFLSNVIPDATWTAVTKTIISNYKKI